MKLKIVKNIGGVYNSKQVRNWRAGLNAMCTEARADYLIETFPESFELVGEIEGDLGVSEIVVMEPSEMLSETDRKEPVDETKPEGADEKELETGAGDKEPVDETKQEGADQAEVKKEDGEDKQTVIKPPIFGLFTRNG